LIFVVLLENANLVILSFLLISFFTFNAVQKPRIVSMHPVSISHFKLNKHNNFQMNY